jgi:hypothetical protein
MQSYFGAARVGGLYFNSSPFSAKHDLGGQSLPRPEQNLTTTPVEFRRHSRADRFSAERHSPAATFSTAPSAPLHISLDSSELPC